MNTNELRLAVSQIDQAELGAVQYRAARRLLDVAGETGHAKLTKDDTRAICMTASEGATRRVLGALQQANIIHYSINGFVYIDFTAWVPQDTCDRTSEKSDHPRAKSDHPRAKSDHPRAKSDHPRAKSDHDGTATESAATPDPVAADRTSEKSDHPRAKSDHPRAIFAHDDPATYTHAHAGGVCLFVDPIHQSPLEKKEQTNKQTPEQALASALLQYVRVKRAVATRLVLQCSLEQIREAISHWWFNRESMGGTFAETPGIVVHWLTNWDNAGVPALSPHFRHTDLYRRFRTAAERQADEEPGATFAPSMPPDPSPAPPEPPGAEPALDENGLLWQQVVAELTVTMPTHVQEWIAGSRVREVDGATWRIAVTDARALDWLQNRLRIKVGKILASMLNQRVTVDFYLETTEES